LKHFKYSIIITIVALIGMGIWGYMQGGVTHAIRLLSITSILALMEISFSFDNAIVNASILKEWNHYWQMIFLTVGMIIAVFGMRLLFPLVIVSQTADIPLFDVWKVAVYAPDEYARILSLHHGEISAFGGIFLLLVFLNFIIDDEKTIHWFKFIEKHLSDLGRINTLPTMISLFFLVSVIIFVDDDKKYATLWAGIWGVIMFLGVKIIGEVLENQHNTTYGVVSSVAKGGIGGFIYLEVLDASFSFDGVIGAFAITTDILTIMVGLGIGAFFVRSMTIYLVEQGTLDNYVYLEHGAHYAIGVLALLMLVSISYHDIPEVITGLVGITFIILSYFSSKKYKEKNLKV